MPSQKKIKDPIFAFPKTIRMFVDQALTQLRVNARTQGMWPTEVYPGYAMINRKRAAAGWSHSTGEGANSFHAVINDATPDGLTITFSFNDYLRFVEMGVGKGTSWNDVQNSRKANYKSRYTKKWNRAVGQSSRPAFSMEIRHVQQRVRDYLADYYGKTGVIQVINTLAESSNVKIV